MRADILQQAGSAHQLVLSVCVVERLELAAELIGVNGLLGLPAAPTTPRVMPTGVNRNRDHESV